MRKYTHKDKSGMLWRFEGMRPISALADAVMAQVDLDLSKGAPKARKRGRAKAAKR